MYKLKLKKSDLESITSFITIDCGTVNLKCLYLDFEDDVYNNNDKNSEIIFSALTFDRWNGLNSFYEHLRSRNTRLKCFQTKLVLITGLESESLKLQISDHLKYDVKVIPEMKAMTRSLQFIINTNNKDNFIYQPEIDETPLDISNDLFTELIESRKKKLELDYKKSTSLNYPILYVSLGGTTRFMLMHETDETKEISVNAYGGETFLGLTKCLLNENDFNLISSLAEKGNRSNVDTQVVDILGTDSPYGHYPADLPVFAFGKAMDINSSVDMKYQKEDICNSLMSMVVDEITNQAERVAYLTACKNIYCGGLFFQHRAFRLEYTKIRRLMPEVITTYFLKGGIESTLGLLLLGKDYKQK